MMLFWFFSESARSREKMYNEHFSSSYWSLTNGYSASICRPPPLKTERSFKFLHLEIHNKNNLWTLKLYCHRHHYLHFYSCFQGSSYLRILVNFLIKIWSNYFQHRFCNKCKCLLNFEYFLFFFILSRSFLKKLLIS